MPAPLKNKNALKRGKYAKPFSLGADRFPEKFRLIEACLKRMASELKRIVEECKGGPLDLMDRCRLQAAIDWQAIVLLAGHEITTSGSEMERDELFQLAKDRAGARVKRNQELAHLSLRSDPDTVFANLYRPAAQAGPKPHIGPAVSDVQQLPAPPEGGA